MLDMGALCANCGKKVTFNESILFQGKTFCSQECKQDFHIKS